MTVSYSLTAATATFAKFFKLLIRWKGSVWKLVYVETLIWTFLTVSVLFLYAFAIRGTVVAHGYEAFVKHVAEEMQFQEMAFILLGFTTGTSISRWMDQYRLLVWPDNLVLLFNTFFDDDAVNVSVAKKLRSTVSRYLIFSYILLLRDVAPSVRKLYPTLESFVDADIATADDIKMLNNSGLKSGMCQYWLPLLWIIAHLKKYYKSNPRMEKDESAAPSSVMDEQTFSTFTNEVLRCRGMMGDILSFDWVPIPMALMHLVTVTCYIAIIHNLVCIQNEAIKIADGHERKYTVVVFSLVWTIFRNIFYMGWLKTMQVILNPFGEDDDDFEITWLLERHFQVVSSILEEPEKEPPGGFAFPLLPKRPTLPHTLASALTAAITNGTNMNGSAVQRRQVAVEEKKKGPQGKRMQESDSDNSISMG